MCIPHIWTLSRPFDSAQNTAFFFFTGSILDLNISVMTATYSFFTPTMTEGFCQFSSMLKGSIIHLKWRGDFSTDCIGHSSASVLPCVETVTPPDLPSSLLHRKPSQTMSIAWPHSCTGCKGRQVHLHTITTDGRIPFQLHFHSRGERSCGAYYCG